MKQERNSMIDNRRLEVRIVKSPADQNLSVGYVPRRFFFMRDARDFVKEIKALGGEAIIAREGR
jgi:hypothetical protein